MANYTKATNFATKDTLPPGDSGKIVKGTEIDSEFNAIASAVSSKADTASPTFTGTPIAPTATAGTNTTQVATTAFVTTAVTAERTATTTLTNKTLTSPTVTGLFLNDSSIVFEGSSADAFETTLTVTNPTADRILTLPNATDTLVGRTTTDTLTNKTVALGSNTVSGTKAQFNTAVTDTDFTFLNDFTGSNVSLTANGYQKLPGGLIMQWGKQPGNIISAATTTFPIPFPNAVFSITATGLSDGSTTYSNNINIDSRYITTTSFVMDSSSTHVNGAYWVAFGH
jgi:hypothetical protein